MDNKKHLFQSPELERILFKYKSDLESVIFLKHLLKVYEQPSSPPFTIKSLIEFKEEVSDTHFIINIFVDMVLLFGLFAVNIVVFLSTDINFIYKFILSTIVTLMYFIYILIEQEKYVEWRPYIFTYTKPAIKQLNLVQLLYNHLTSFSFAEIKDDDFIEFLQDPNNQTILERLDNLPENADVQKLIILNFDNHYWNRWRLKQKKDKDIKIKEQEIRLEIEIMDNNVQTLSFLLVDELEIPHYDLLMNKVQRIKTSGDLLLIQETNKKLESLMIAASRQNLSTNQILSGI